MTGDLARPENDDRARRLTDCWNAKWPNSEPLGYVLRGDFPERWVRFHSLPDSKRYAGTPEEAAEILRRHRTVLAELHGSDVSELVVVGADWGPPDIASGWSKNHLNDPWLWRVAQDTFDPEAGPVYCWVQSGVDDAALDALLTAAANDAGRFLVADPGLNWLYCPYGGGVDVLLGDHLERDALRDRHSDWLSGRSDGL